MCAKPHSLQEQHASQPSNCLPRAVRCSWGSWQAALPSEVAVGSARASPASAASLSSVSRPGFPCFLGRKVVSLPFPGTSLSFLATFFPCSRRERTAPPGLEGGEVPLHSGHLRSCRMAFQSRSFKARLCLLAPPSLSSLPLRSITHSDSLVFEKLPAPRSPCLQIHQWQHKGKT